MTNHQVRQRIAIEAARLMYHQRASFGRAKSQAAEQVAGGRVPQRLMPSHREIRAAICRLAQLHDAFDERLLVPEVVSDRFELYGGLIAPLEQVRQSPKWHPEGDALYHTLQVFDLARDALPYDEELLLAALLHDVGRAIDPWQPLEATLDAIGELVTPRTFWLVEHHPQAQTLLEGALGGRARRRLEESEHFDELMLLARCDRAGRVPGAAASELDEALGYVRELAEMCGDEADDSSQAG
jgi:hypothetical protein